MFKCNQSISIPQVFHVISDDTYKTNYYCYIQQIEQVNSPNVVEYGDNDTMA